MKKNSRRSKSSARTVIPTLVGLTKTQAEAALAAANLNYSSSIVITNYNSENEKVTEVSNYSAGQSVPYGTNVSYKYKAYQGIAVPNVSGLSQTAALAAITAAGLTAGTVSGTTGSDSSLDQKITGQSVAAGNLVDALTTVNITLYTYVAPYYNPYSNPPPYDNYGNYGNYDNYSNPPPPPDPPAGPPEIPPLDLPPSGWKSLGVHTLVRTPEGLVAAGSLKVGDVLISADIDGVPYMSSPEAYESIYNWTDSEPNIEYTTTTIVMAHKKTGDTVVAINGDIFSQYHYILVKRDGLARFIATADIIATDQIYSYASNSFEPITMLQMVPVSHEIVSIDCEPYDIFFTQEMLVHDSVSV